jgi:hypothetical protein
VGINDRVGVRRSTSLSSYLPLISSQTIQTELGEGFHQVENTTHVEADVTRQAVAQVVHTDGETTRQVVAQVVDADGEATRRAVTQVVGADREATHEVLAQVVHTDGEATRQLITQVRYLYLFKLSHVTDNGVTVLELRSNLGYVIYHCSIIHCTEFQPSRTDAAVRTRRTFQSRDQTSDVRTEYAVGDLGRCPCLVHRKCFWSRDGHTN